MLVLVSLVSFAASVLTFYSGFGLGTLLSAVLFLFMDVPSALMVTAIVHLLNNLFKLLLVGKNIDIDVLKKFGLASISGAIIGSFLLRYTQDIEPLYSYILFGKTCSITIIKIFMALLIVFFTLFETLSYFKKLKFNSINFISGGLISGFFGGLSGHQGALRSAFLIKANLNKESFIGTGVAIACFVDISRLPMYFATWNFNNIQDNITVIICATIAAFIGAFIGSKFIKKVTLEVVQKIVSFFLIFISLLLLVGYL